MSTANPQPSQPSLESEQRAHEPSMEEILASIRRIIADDDALPLMRRPSLVTRETPAASSADRPADLPRHAPAAAASTPPVVHLVPVPSGEAGATVVHPDSFGSGREEYAAKAPVCADEQELRPSFADDLPEEEAASAPSAPVPETRVTPPAAPRDH